MNVNSYPEASGFWMAGISYQKTDTPTRGAFAVGRQAYEDCLAQAPAFGVSAMFILSTCNRTEIYGCAATPSLLINLLCAQTQGSAETFTELAYVRKGDAAAVHLFRVSAGLDSQLLGDYEIVGQLKQAVKVARDLGFINTFLDRLVSAVLQASKCIKNNTALSNGAVSVAFAAIQYIKAAVTDPADQRILLLGAGKIGCSTCKNLVDYLGASRVVVISRSEEKAAQIACRLGLSFAPLDQLAAQAALADIIIVCTNAPEPVLLKSHLALSGKKLVIDLSVPGNVEPSVGGLPQIKLAGLDEVSRLNDQSLRERLTDVPKAEAIIAGQLAIFLEWCRTRNNGPVLKAIHIRLKEIALQHGTTEYPIRQVLGGTADKMRAGQQPGCLYLAAINELMLNLHP